MTFASTSKTTSEIQSAPSLPLDMEKLRYERLTAVKEHYGDTLRERHYPGQCSLSPSANVFVAFGASGDIKVGKFDGDTSKFTELSSGKINGHLWGAAITDDMSRVVVAGAHCGIQVLDARNPEISKPIYQYKDSGPGCFYKAEISADGKTVAAVKIGELFIIRGESPETYGSPSKSRFDGLPVNLKLEAKGQCIAIETKHNDEGHDWNATKSWSAVTTFDISNNPEKPIELGRWRGSESSVYPRERDSGVSFLHAGFDGNTFKFRRNDFAAPENIKIEPK